MATRSRLDFAYGIASGIVNGGQTTITGTNWPTPVAGTYVPVVLNPGYYGATGTQEIIYVTSSGTATVAVVQRQAEGGFGPVTTGVSGTVPWVAGPLVTDFGIVNQINNGDFPSPTASGQFFVSSASGGNSPYWSNIIPAGVIQYVYDSNSGSTIYVANTTDINNIVQVSGTCTIQLPSSGITYGQQITFMQLTSGTLTTFSGGATIISTGALNSGANPLLRAQYSVATAIYLGTTVSPSPTWMITGDII
jgi:hypothetical protein